MQSPEERHHACAPPLSAARRRAAARAEAYPARPVNLVLGFPPGQSGDISARLLGQRLGERLGRSFRGRQSGEAASTIATEFLVHASPHGDTLLCRRHQQRHQHDA